MGLCPYEAKPREKLCKHDSLGRRAVTEKRVCYSGEGQTAEEGVVDMKGPGLPCSGSGCSRRAWRGGPLEAPAQGSACPSRGWLLCVFPFLPGQGRATGVSYCKVTEQDRFFPSLCLGGFPAMEVLFKIEILFPVSFTEMKF